MDNNTTEYKELPLHLIDPPAHMIRMSIDQNYIRELANDIRSNGLLQPLVVCPKGNRYEIIAGHRRFLAMQSIGWPTTMCHVKTVEANDIAICRASENLSRVDMTPIEEALTYKDLIVSFGMTYETIADRLGKSPALIKRRVDLLNMPEEMQNAIHEKKITTGVAESLLCIHDRTALSYYLSCAIDNGVTVDVARQWASDWKLAQIHQAHEAEAGCSIPSAFTNRTSYISCETCGGPEDIQKVKMLRICMKCFKLCMNAIQRKE